MADQKMTKTAFGRLTIAKVKSAVAVDGITLVTGKDSYAFIGKAKTASTDEPTTQPTPTPDPTPTPNPTPTPTPTGVDPAFAAKYFDGQDQIDGYVGQYPELAKIAGVPSFKWLGEWSGNIWQAVRTQVLAAREQGKTAMFVLYNIPNRDNGQYSAGGVANNDAYYAWVGAIADAIGNDKAIIVLEPDALGLSKDQNDTDRQKRYDALHGAVAALKAKPNTEVFIDASMWVSTDVMADMLKRVNIDKADGFIVNVSGFEWLDKCVEFADAVSEKVGNKPYLIDTSRNGKGPWENPNQEKDPWCNPPARQIGEYPTLSPSKGKHCRAYVWCKAIGESDGDLRGWGSAGTFSPQLALNLLHGN